MPEKSKKTRGPLLVSVVLAAVFVLAMVPAALAERARITAGGAEGWTIEADVISGDSKTRTVEAAGSVVMTSAASRLTAERVQYSETSRQAQAEGGVRLVTPDFELTATRFSFNLATGEGVISDGLLYFPTNNYYIHAKTMARTGVDTFTIEEGMITTCDGERPAWSLKASRIQVRREGYASARNARVQAGSVPIFYTPYLVVPVKTKRQSGFLIPEIKTSDRDGLTVNLPFFLALTESRDATLTLTAITNRGYNLGGELRLKEWNGQSLFRLDFFNDLDPPSTVGSENRFWARGMSDYETESGFEIKLDFDFVSDAKYLPEFERAAFGFAATNEQLIGEFGRSLDEPRDRLRRNIAKMSRRMGPMYLDMAVILNDDLSGQGSGAAALQRAPSLNLGLPFTWLGTRGLAFAMESNYSYLTRASGATGHRWDIHPRFYWPLKVGGVSLLPELGARETLYSAHGVEAGQRDGFAHRELLDASLTASTRLWRVFELSGSRFARLKHEIQPVVRYSYVSGASQDELPFFDAHDRVDPAEAFEYGLVNSFTLKLRPGQGDQAPRYVEFLRLKLFRTYNLLKARESAYTQVDRATVHGPWSAEYLFLLWPYFEVEGASRYDTNSSRFIQHDISLTARDHRGDEAEITYNYHLGRYEEITYRLLVKVTGQAFFEVENRYSIRESLNLEGRFALLYRSQCWAVRLEYLDRPEEKSLAILITLTGLGDVGSYSFNPGLR